MQVIHTPKAGEGASVSRRKFMAFAAAGSAATLPAVALAEASGKTSRLPQSLEARVDDCVEHLRELLAEMHPTVFRSSFNLKSGEDGSFYFCMQGYVQYIEFAGDGLYEVSMDGYLVTWWLEKDCKRSLATGKPIPGLNFYRATLWDDGSPTIEQREMYEPKLVRKIDRVSA